MSQGLAENRLVLHAPGVEDSTWGPMEGSNFVHRLEYQNSSSQVDTPC